MSELSKEKSEELGDDQCDLKIRNNKYVYIFFVFCELIKSSFFKFRILY